jgi:hypothetical protein
MKREKTKKQSKTSSEPEKITAEEALSKMKDFTRRKEQIIADIRARKN